MHSIEIPDRALTVTFPDCWEECTPEQITFIVENAFLTMTGDISLAEFQIRVFKHLTGLKIGWQYHLRTILGRNQAENEAIYRLSSQLCSWIFQKTQDDSYELKYDSIVNPFPVLMDKYHGPGDLLATLTMGEFKMALAELDQYLKSAEEPEQAQVHLDFMIGILYRPKDDNGKILPYHHYVVRPEIFANVPIWKKQAIVMWFTYCVRCLQTEDLVINGIDVNFSALFPTADHTRPTNRHQVNLGWAGIIYNIAETGVFGDAAQTSQTPLYDILLFLLKKHQDQKALKK